MDVGVGTPVEVVRALAKHPLITDVLCGHPGNIVMTVARLSVVRNMEELYGTVMAESSARDPVN